MGAISAFGGPGPVSVRAINAGVDGLLVCRRREHREQVVEALAREASRHPAFAKKLEAAARRLASIPFPEKKGSLPRIGSPPHLALQERVVRRLTRDAE